jgi:hypothetical protein
MAIAFYMEFADMSTVQAEQALQQLKLNGRSPKGQLFHSEGPTESGGTWVFDLWESEQACGAFFEQSLGPIMVKLGVTPPHPKMLKARVALSPQEFRHL